MPKKCQDQIHVGKKPQQKRANLLTKSKENVRRKNLVLVDIFSNQEGTSLSGGHNLPTTLNDKKVKTQFILSYSSDIEFDTESNQRNCIRGGLQNEFKFSGRGGVKRHNLQNKGKIDQSKFMREKRNNLPTALNNKKVKTQFKPSDSSDIEFESESIQRNCIRGGLQNEFKFSQRGGVKRLHLQNKGKIDQSKFMREKSNNQQRREANIQNKFIDKFANARNKYSMGGKSIKVPRKITSAQSRPQSNFMSEKSNNLPRGITSGPKQIHEWKKQQPTKENNQLQGHYGETSDVGDDEIPDFENEPEGNIFFYLLI